ncbi:uncharacterized protein B0P05DRAFT_584067 [Gilbertella persicaria]|uniref:uncharacterized protein n=1 Tax=Gilbertella persicaria TaxID=101096 RepID=UPI002220AC5E|nr:uncharacterized protein B0P05DRAFT_584067 [Gilbertella persicaria]KAI8090949.1 hypothetical protein B0P05DRAFT_584067 [Gilbertella persicaria]
MSSSQYLIPKDPPSYESIYHTLPPQTSLETQESRLSKATAVFVAATVSATVMLLLWQLQNLASPPEVDDPWLDLEFATS